uniref:Uncharacterized protein n=1 Tax=Arundo donax TaxID=35708 RepID=A0A0A8Y8C3_ARUDO
MTSGSGSCIFPVALTTNSCSWMYGSTLMCVLL